MILLIDNYDSFTYNVYQGIGELYEHIEVVRNDEITLEEIEKKDIEALIISPGPGYPESAGISKEAVRCFAGRVPILGICLGHQAIGEVFGAKTVHAQQLMHGKQSNIQIDSSVPLFHGLPETIPVARYHSLIVAGEGMPDVLSVVGTDDEGQIMAVKHKDYDVYGIQFHPESILTESGKTIFENFLKIAGIEIKEEKKENEMETAQRTVMKPYLEKIVEGKHLTADEAYEAMDCIMSGGATQAQIASFVTGLRMNHETVDEITGFAKVMRAKAAVVPNETEAIDIVGTGGDLASSFNISTTSAFVIAGAGQKVAKHGNRSVSSKSGAADVLEALGAKIGLSPEQNQKCLEEIGVAFLFAQTHHGSMKYAGPVRAQLGVRSVFNILGPLANPAMTNYIVLGVYEEELLRPMAEVMQNLGVKQAMIVYGDDCLDEISISDTTSICEIRDGKLISYKISPEEFGISMAEKDSIKGGTSDENAVITREILTGKEQGPKRDIVLLNAGSALYTIGAAKDMQEGIEMARKSIDSGKALEKLNQFIEFTNRY
ncbi:bifunctional anthranilate synthase component II/anthranilate phosphoribosyltransferase [Anaerostipes sp.]|uniref:bifunctional anthranilate synthase component II/anthranilate phosphoribosyltransferase n=1 Tax=Anaerostipes sp. TaxID=1872530 RepID=UPI0025C68DC8|nr:bifunctional anthranilate synthase component II/anthranilate phosphoribosyltransferase [Anaerostipes sp.]MBS7007172.1 bifunctional anthranilate synthase component II/anthranilate phosphoribosyltransferase [Anaerostipes sp.]